ncbi:MarR family winged helix-turn-helix transcriptional regulator [Sphingomonas psychrolutea]|uniref:Transcriptional regulator n=1 Tax=Sphingomonas psychrolutea TaxID=1259676 RepID=A0ABQ1G6C7_9SPHN|nr:MarR family transcriptional regulator [Sphingomonas psychrolutea]GGA37577.1 transcriptional regulator [Sphingomonas psychrolutea]
MSEVDSFEPDNLKRGISLKLTVIARVMRNRFDMSVTPHGITRSQWTLIALVATQPGASQRTIAERLEMTAAAAGRLIERLCSDGLLERRQDMKDKRAWRVYLAAAAEPMLALLTELGLAIESRTFAGLSPEEIAHLAALLDKVHANLIETKG